jgi:hypothetical protein
VEAETCQDEPTKTAAPATLGKRVEGATVSENDTAACEESEKVMAPTVAVMAPLRAWAVSTEANAAPFSSALSRCATGVFEEKTLVNAFFTKVDRSLVEEAL